MCDFTEISTKAQEETREISGLFCSGEISEQQESQADVSHVFLTDLIVVSEKLMRY